MAETLTEEQLLAEGATPDAGLTEEELLAEGATPLELPTPQRMIEELSVIGKGAADVVGSGVTAIGDMFKYFDAPLKETAMIPKRLYESKSIEDVGTALEAPLFQVGEPGDAAPDWNEVYSAYGVPNTPESAANSLSLLSDSSLQQYEDRGVSPENLPTLDSYFQENKESLPTPAQALGAATEMYTGGEGLKVAGKFIKGAAKAGANVLGHATDLVTGSNFTSGLGRQAVDTVKDTISEGIDMAKKFADPKKVNTFYVNENPNVVKEIFGDDIPNTIKYTKDSEIVKMQNKLSRMDYGGEVAKKQNGAIQKTWDYLVSIPQKIASMAPSVGRPLEPRQVGQYIIDNYNKVKNSVINNADITRNTIIEQLGKSKADPIVGSWLKRNILGQTDYPPITDNSKSSMLKTVEKVKDKVRSMSVGRNNPLAEQLAEIKLIADDVGNIKDINDLKNKIKSVADLAFNMETPLRPQDKQALEQLYHAMSNAFTESIRFHFGDDIAKSLVENNKNLADFFKKSGKIDSFLSEKSMQKLPPEEVFKALIQNGNSIEMDQLKYVLTKQTPEQIAKKIIPEHLDVIRSSHLNSVLNSAVSFEEDIPIVKWKKIAENLKKDQFFDMFFSPEEKSRIISALEIGNDIGKPVLKGEPIGVGNAISRMLYNPALKRHINVMEKGAKVYDEYGNIGNIRDALIMGLKKQNMYDNFVPPMMTPEEQINLIDQDAGLTPTQRAMEKQKIFSATK